MKFVVDYQPPRGCFGITEVLDLEATTEDQAWDEANLIKHRPGGYSIRNLYQYTPEDEQESIEEYALANAY
jgi:hypothetical protein